MTSDERIQEFQAAYGADFGEEITPAEAREILDRLVNFYTILMRPLPEVSDESVD
jgi:hypothetical protein